MGIETGAEIGGAVEADYRQLSNTLLTRFRVRGNVRFLSHRETMNVFQRALVRAGLPVRYSEGYSPHIRFSLPLPRSVGVESDAEMACILLENGPEVSVAGGEQGERVDVADGGRWMESLAAKLPDGLEITFGRVVRGRVRLHPVSVTYVFPVAGRPGAEIRAAVRRITAGQDFCVVRPGRGRKQRDRRVNVAGFIEQVQVCEAGSGEQFGCGGQAAVVVRCGVSQSGTARVAELMQVLGLDEAGLAGPVRRCEVEWTESVA